MQPNKSGQTAFRSDVCCLGTPKTIPAHAASHRTSRGGVPACSMMALHPRPRVELPGLGLRSRASVRCLIRSRYTAVVKEDCKTGPVCVFNTWCLGRAGFADWGGLDGPGCLQNHSTRWGASPHILHYRSSARMYTYVFNTWFLVPAGNRRVLLFGRPQRPPKPFQKVGGEAPHMFEGFPWPQRRIKGRREPSGVWGEGNF